MPASKDRHFCSTLTLSRTTRQRGLSSIVETYDYTDGEGRLLYQVVRYQPKAFAQRRPDGKGGWIWNLGEIPPVPYRLPELILAVDTVLVAEGERDCDRLASLGWTATTNPGGAGNWKPELNKYFAGKDMCIIPDNDEAGRRHARKVGAQLFPVANSVKIVHLPDLAEKGDVCDWLDAGHTGAELRWLTLTTPAWQPVGDQKPAKIKPPRFGRKSAGTIAELKRSVRIQDVVGRYVKLHRVGRNLRGLCPFHPDRDPSFFIFPDQYFQCFGCGAKGDVLEFVRRIEKLSLAEAIKELDRQR